MPHLVILSTTGTLFTRFEIAFYQLALAIASQKSNIFGNTRKTMKGPSAPTQSSKSFVLELAYVCCASEALAMNQAVRRRTALLMTLVLSSDI